jgi:hypothetical protein
MIRMAPHFKALLSELNKRGRNWDPETSGAVFTEIRPDINAYAWDEFDGEIGTWRVRLFTFDGDFNDARYNDDEADTGLSKLTVKNAAELARAIDEALDALLSRAGLKS